MGGRSKHSKTSPGKQQEKKKWAKRNVIFLLVTEERPAPLWHFSALQLAGAAGSVLHFQSSPSNCYERGRLPYAASCACLYRLPHTAPRARPEAREQSILHTSARQSCQQGPSVRHREGPQGRELPGWPRTCHTQGCTSGRDGAPWLPSIPAVVTARRSVRASIALLFWGKETGGSPEHTGGKLISGREVASDCL